MATINYLTRAAAAADKVYPKIVALGCKHASGAKTYTQMVSKKIVTCATSASIVYQQAGILGSGEVVSHRKAAGGSDSNIRKKKPTVAKAMTGAGYLPEDKVEVKWVGKKYADLPAKYRQKGVMYIQDSNVCICAGNGAIYSCNNAKGGQVNSQGKYVRNKITSGYAFNSPILVVIVPKVKEVPDVANLNIIDVSQFNGTIDWKKAAPKIDGAIIKAGFRSASGTLNTDPCFVRNISGAVAAGVKRIGVYWWTAHTSTEQAKGDAAYLAKLLKPYQKHINFGVWLDSEGYVAAVKFNQLSAGARTTYALVFLTSMAAAGYQTGIYSSDSWFGTHLELSRISKYPMWVAKYSSVPPKVVKRYVGWQYTDKGKVDGIRGNVDKSHFYSDLAKGQTNTVQEVHDMDTLRKGDQGQQVKVLQKLLGGVAIDGIFGANTKAAVEAYQRQYKLSVDGVVGPKTWDKLLG